MKTPTQEQNRINRQKGEGSIYRHTDGRWMYSVMFKGKRLTKSLGTRDEVEALRNYKRVRNNFAGRIDRGELEPSTVANVTLQDILDSYLKHIQKKRPKSAYVIETVLRKVGRAPEFGDGKTAIRKVATLETADFERYRERITSKGGTDRTVDSHFCYLHAALKLETKRTPSRVRTIPYIPMLRVDRVRDGFLEYADYASVLDALPVSLKPVFVVLSHSGCRRGEVLKMKWADVDWQNRVIRLPDSKNGRKRNLPFWGLIEEHLKAQLAYRDAHHPESAHLFFWRATDVQLARGGVRNAPGAPVEDFRASWAKAIKAAHNANPRVPAELLVHDLRRSAVRVMIQEAGLPESQAMLISGHETPAMLHRYNIVSLRNIQDAGAKLDAWARSKSSHAA